MFLPNICLHQLLKCHEMALSFDLYHNKLNILGIWIAVCIKQAICRTMEIIIILYFVPTNN